MKILPNKAVRIVTDFMRTPTGLAIAWSTNKPALPPPAQEIIFEITNDSRDYLSQKSEKYLDQINN